MAVAAVIGAQLLSNYMGQQQAQSQQDAANKARQQALAQYTGLTTPSIAEQVITPEAYQGVGSLNPDLSQTEQIGGTAMSGIQTDPRLQASQMAALQQLAGYANGQMTPGDQAAFQLAQKDAQAQIQAKNGQILQDLQQRGQGGSGAELLAKLKSNQSGADALQSAELQQAQALQQAKMAALGQQASLSTTMRNQDYSQQSDLAKAKDAIAAWNAQNSQAVQNANTNVKNTAAATNLANAQSLANSNVSSRNTAQQQNKGLYQQQFNNQLGLANGASGQYNNSANASQQQAANTAGMWGGIGQAAGTAIANYANSPSSSTPKTSANTNTTFEDTNLQPANSSGYFGS